MCVCLRCVLERLFVCPFFFHCVVVGMCVFAVRWGCTCRSSGCRLMPVSSTHWTPLSSSPSLSCAPPPSPPPPHQNPLVKARRQDCYLWDRHRADLRLISLLPCGSHWKQMVSKQPVMFTAAAIKDKSPTTHSLRSPTGSHRGLQTAAWGGPLALHARAWTHTLTPWTDSYLNYHPNASITKHTHTNTHTHART